MKKTKEIVIEDPRKIAIEKIARFGSRFSRAKGDILPDLISVVRPLYLWVQQVGTEMKYFVDGGGGMGSCEVDSRDAYRVLRYAIRHNELAV